MLINQIFKYLLNLQSLCSYYSILKWFSITILDKSDDEEKTDMWAYQVIIEKLMYLVCDIRSDISFVIKYLN